MLTEMQGKGGRVCRPAQEGTMRCPLIVRPNSEDVVTGELFGVLAALNPRWWLADLLNTALGAKRFDRRMHRQFQVHLWEKQPHFPQELIPWREGATEVDAVLTWENPPTTVFVEMKYHSPLSATTVHHRGEGEFPSDQLVRNARVGLWKCGWYEEDRLFDDRRDFVLVLLGKKKGEPLVDLYRDPERLRALLPHGSRIARLPKLPRLPFIGELGYADVARVVTANRRYYSRAERVLIDRLEAYLAMKRRGSLTAGG